MTEMCRMRSSSLAESLAGSSVGSGRFKPPSWWWMWKSSVPFSSHCCRQRTRGISSELPEISMRDKITENKENYFMIISESNQRQLWWDLIVFMSLSRDVQWLTQEGWFFFFFFSNFFAMTVLLIPPYVHVKRKNSTYDYAKNGSGEESHFVSSGAEDTLFYHSSGANKYHIP